MLFKTSIRFCLILTACIAAGLWWLGPLTHSTIRQTSRQLDVAIVGPGYFCVHDDSSLESRFTRLGNIQIDKDRKLVITVNEKAYPIHPPITVLSGSEKLEITPDGFVHAATRAGVEIIGRFQFACFRSDSPFSSPWSINSATTRSGNEKPHDPLRGAGSLKQGHLEYSPPEKRSVIGTLTLSLLSGFLLNYWITRFSKHRKNASALRG
jgi:hypothetical protein